MFEREVLGEAQRRAVLSGKSAEGMTDPGPIVFACLGVGLNLIKAAIESGEVYSVEQIGAALRRHKLRFLSAGTKRIVDHERTARTA